MKRVGTMMMMMALLGIVTGCGTFTSRSRTARALLWLDADVGDLNRFPARFIPNAPPVSALHVAAEPARW